jgi:hypothetical protein
VRKKMVPIIPKNISAPTMLAPAKVRFRSSPTGSIGDSRRASITTKAAAAAAAAAKAARIRASDHPVVLPSIRA